MKYASSNENKKSVQNEEHHPLPTPITDDTTAVEVHVAILNIDKGYDSDEDSAEMAENMESVGGDSMTGSKDTVP